MGILYRTEATVMKWFQDTTEKIQITKWINCYYLAYLSLRCLQIVIISTGILSWIHFQNSKNDFVLFMLSLSIVLFLMLFKFPKRLRNFSQNPDEIYGFIKTHRLIFWTVGLIMIVASLRFDFVYVDSLGVVAYWYGAVFRFFAVWLVVHMYLMSCTPFSGADAYHLRRVARLMQSRKKKTSR